jgi:hypothetical protein
VSYVQVAPGKSRNQGSICMEVTRHPSMQVSTITDDDATANVDTRVPECEMPKWSCAPRASYLVLNMFTTLDGKRCISESHSP